MSVEAGNSTEITAEMIAKHGITPEEYTRIEEILGRTPNLTELGIFSVMWSEHCSYKNSRLELKKFPTTGERVLVKAGEENAGVIDIGDGWAVCFKMESHNHPSAVEPFQGAATGVGGIIRDIFTMGARPVFSLNSLRFGPISGEGPQQQNNRRLFSGVVAGISHYGNCIGIPTIGGEVYFDSSYQGNPLVNVFCLGVLRHEQIARGAAEGIGNPVFYVGAETGRDGLAGAAFASRELTEESKEDRPAVQVGDPFKEKLLLEACLELLESGCVAGIQDMGAAGLTCSTCETASRGGTGVEIDLALVPQREPGMTPYETMLSESQERMLIIVKKGEEETVRRIFEKWDLPYAEVGQVKDDGMMRVLGQGQVVAEIPAAKLADEAPVYERESCALEIPQPVDPDAVPELSPEQVLPKLLADPSIASKHWVYRQYDHMVRIGTVVPPGSDAAVFYIREAGKYVAATSDCNSTFCRLDPYTGAQLAVSEAALNLACSGARPLAVTDNLNFGNPYKPRNFSQLRAAVEGMAEACRCFGTPVTGGNVSLYNESPEAAVDPTPTVGMVGLIDEPEHITRQFFRAAGDDVVLVGGFGDELGGSHYLKLCHAMKEGRPPVADLDMAKLLVDTLLAAIRSGLVRSTHDCSEGGLAVALAECCFGDPPLGAEIDLGDTGVRPDVLWFNESARRVVLTTAPESTDKLIEVFATAGLTAKKIGTTGGDRITLAADRKSWSWELDALRQSWSSAIADLMAGVEN